MKIKKLFSAIIAIMIAASLCACGNTEDSSKADKTTVTTTTAVNTTTPEETTTTFAQIEDGTTVNVDTTAPVVTTAPEQVTTTTVATTKATVKKTTTTTKKVTTTKKATTTTKPKPVTTTKKVTTTAKATTTTKKVTTTTKKSTSEQLPEGVVHKFTQEEINKLAAHAKEYTLSRGGKWDDNATFENSSWCSGDLGFYEYDFFDDYKSAEKKWKKWLTVGLMMDSHISDWR